jgi:hypothetical protein
MKGSSWNCLILGMNIDKMLGPFVVKGVLRLYLGKFITIEIKPCGLGPTIRDVEAFWYKMEIKIIYFVPLCLMLWFTLILNF